MPATMYLVVKEPKLQHRASHHILAVAVWATSKAEALRIAPPLTPDLFNEFKQTYAVKIELNMKMKL